MEIWRRELDSCAEDRREPEYSGLRCCRCQAGLWGGELHGRRGDRRICLDCAEREWERLPPGAKLELLGYDTEV